MIFYTPSYKVHCVYPIPCRYIISIMIYPQDPVKLVSSTKLIHVYVELVEASNIKYHLHVVVVQYVNYIFFYLFLSGSFDLHNRL